MWGYMPMWGGGLWDESVPAFHVATLDLAASAGASSSRWRWSDEWDLAAYPSMSFRKVEAAVARCAGETFLLYDFRLRVLAPGCSGGRLVEVASLSEPSMAMTGICKSQYRAASWGFRFGVSLVAHRGVVLYVKGMMCHKVVEADVVMSVWRLARHRLKWRLVARLDAAELARLTGLANHEVVSCHFWGACGVGKFVHCCVRVNAFVCILRLNPGDWQLVLQTNCGFAEPFELRPDLFL